MNDSVFESIKHISDEGDEFWYARELQFVLEYAEWRNFNKVIEKAKTACKNAANDVELHFVEVNKTLPMPNGGNKKMQSLRKNKNPRPMPPTPNGGEMMRI